MSINSARNKQKERESKRNEDEKRNWTNHAATVASGNKNIVIITIISTQLMWKDDIFSKVPLCTCTIFSVQGYIYDRVLGQNVN